MNDLRLVADPDAELEALRQPPDIELTVKVREPDYDEAA